MKKRECQPTDSVQERKNAMADTIREEGFLVSPVGGSESDLSRAEFYTSKEEAEAAAKGMLPTILPVMDGFPVFVIPVTRFTTKEIERLRGRR